jgi:hypothetical protein
MSDEENTDDDLIGKVFGKEIFEKVLADYAVVHLVVMYHELVVLPEFIKTKEWFERKGVIHLEYGLNMPVPIMDIEAKENGVSATLSFQRVPHHTFIPWKAVVGMSLDGPLEAKPEPTPEPVPAKKKSFLKLVP